MRIHRATPEFIAEMKKAGFSGMSVDELLQFRIHNVSPEHVAELGRSATRTSTPTSSSKRASTG